MLLVKVRRNTIGLQPAAATLHACSAVSSSLSSQQACDSFSASVLVSTVCSCSSSHSCTYSQLLLPHLPLPPPLLLLVVMMLC
jgi:hypothetical protein